MSTQQPATRYRGYTILPSASGEFEFIMSPAGYDCGAVRKGEGYSFVDRQTAASTGGNVKAYPR